MNKFKELIDKIYVRLILLGVSGFLILLSSLNIYIESKLPDENKIRDIELQVPLKIYTEDRPSFYQEVSFVQNSMLGDLNSDFVLDILDIVLMVNVIMLQIEDPGNADLNSDGFVNVLDIVQLVNLILND